MSQKADPSPLDAASLLIADAQRVAHALRNVLQRQLPEAPRRLVEAIEYSVMAGGKRLRPTLVLETGRACSGLPASAGVASDPPGASALAGAVAIELIHTFSLVHDDLPAMDDDDLRRGRPTNHNVFGEAMAILAGDAMVTLAFETIARDADPSVAPALVRELACAAGPQGMIGGQVLDIAGEGKRLSLDELRQVHRLKTGALLTAACRMGAVAARAGDAQLESVTAFGRHLGIAFQIVDDVLDVTATPEQMGKATGKDAGKGKNTYPALLGLDQSQRAARDHLDAALSALAGFGPAGEGLRTLARFVVERTN